MAVDVAPVTEPKPAHAVEALCEWVVDPLWGWAQCSG